MIGLNYVSCSPYRVPIARLAAAQSELKKLNECCEKILIFISVFTVFITISVNYYFEFIGLGDPVRYDKDLVYGFAPKANQKRKDLKVQLLQLTKAG